MYYTSFIPMYYVDLVELGTKPCGILYTTSVCSKKWNGMEMAPEMYILTV